MDKKQLKAKAVKLFIAALAVVGALLFIPAGTLDYWQAWAFMFTLFAPFFFVIFYLIGKDPELVERRLRYKEKVKEQSSLIKFSYPVFFAAFLLTGFDKRFGWSFVPAEVSIISDFIVFLGYMLTFLTLRENSYASRIIEVEKKQKVITTGPYAVVRHPMYLGVSLMYLFMPLALGSLVGFAAFTPIIAVIVIRLLNEEKILLKELKGYKAYCKKTKYRLIPFIW